MEVFNYTKLWLLILLIILLCLNCSYITHGIASIISNSFPEAIYYIETNEKLIALTVDDGPDSNTTIGIIELLS